MKMSAIHNAKAAQPFAATKPPALDKWWTHTSTEEHWHENPGWAKIHFWTGGEDRHNAERSMYIGYEEQKDGSWIRYYKGYDYIGVPEERFASKEEAMADFSLNAPKLV